VTTGLIYQVVARVYGVTEADILGHDRRQPFARARQVAVYCLYKYGSLSTTELGRAFGYADHTTALYAIRRIGALAHHDNKVRRVLLILDPHVFCRPPQRPIVCSGCQHTVSIPA